MSARHHYIDADPEAWGGLGAATAPRANCARPDCPKHARDHGGELDEYCSDACARKHLGTCRSIDCTETAAAPYRLLGGYCSRVCADASRLEWD